MQGAGSPTQPLWPGLLWLNSPLKAQMERTGFLLPGLLAEFAVLQSADRGPQIPARLLARSYPPFPGTRASLQSISQCGS